MRDEEESLLPVPDRDPDSTESTSTLVLHRLHPFPLLSDTFDDEGGDTGFRGLIYLERLGAEAFGLLALGLPLIAEEVLAFLSVTLALIFAGHGVPASTLSAIYLARSLVNVSGSAWIVGTTGPVDTYVAQASGAGNPRLVGTVLVRAVVISTVLSLPVLAMWLGMQSHWGVIVDDADLAAAAGRWIVIFSPWIVMHTVVIALIRGLIAQGKTHLRCMLEVIFEL
jgi:Na+-driven multidrug efflux pump